MSRILIKIFNYFYRNLFVSKNNLFRLKYLIFLNISVLK